MSALPLKGILLTIQQLTAVGKFEHDCRRYLDSGRGQGLDNLNVKSKRKYTRKRPYAMQTP